MLPRRVRAPEPEPGVALVLVLVRERETLRLGSPGTWWTGVDDPALGVRWP
jgi:hypothetical protein